MLAMLRAGLSNVLRSKIGLAVIGAMLIGGGGTAAMALATAHLHLPSVAQSATLPPSHATPTATATAHVRPTTTAPVRPTSVAGAGPGHRGHHHSHP